MDKQQREREEQEFIETWREFERKKDHKRIIAVSAILCSMVDKRHNAESDGHMIAGYTKGEYKRAIHITREVQAQNRIDGRSDLAQCCEDAISYIRKYGLRR